MTDDMLDSVHDNNFVNITNTEKSAVDFVKLAVENTYGSCEGYTDRQPNNTFDFHCNSTKYDFTLLTSPINSGCLGPKHPVDDSPASKFSECYNDTSFWTASVHGSLSAIMDTDKGLFCQCTGALCQYS